MKYIIFLLIVLLINLVYACNTDNSFLSNEDIIICTDDCVYMNTSNYSQFIDCDDSVTCRITSFFPNGTLISAYENMSRNGTYFYYNITNYVQNITGTFYSIINCYRSIGWFDDEFSWTINAYIPASDSTGGGISGGGGVSSVDHSTYALCSNILNFLKENVKNEELNYDDSSLQDLTNKINNDIPASYNITYIDSYLKDYNDKCDTFEKVTYKVKKSFWEKYKYYIIFISIIIIGVIMLEYSRRYRKKKGETWKQSLVPLK